MPARFAALQPWFPLEESKENQSEKRTFASLKFLPMIELKLIEKVSEAVKVLYGSATQASQIQVQVTRKEFEGDFTVVVFPFTRNSRKSPETTANEIGEYLQTHLQEVVGFNVIKGFLNISIKKEYWLSFLSANYKSEKYGFRETENDCPVVVEFSSPNTNKPLHLGHIRNNLLGFSLSRILEAAGKNVVKVNLVNDRGIHICKSMIAWQKWGIGETPETSGLKGDQLVGKYYVIFDKHYKQQIADLLADGNPPEVAAKNAPLILEAQQLLQKWESGDLETIALWKTMNGWVYEGFAKTYQTLGIQFDKTYYESQTYLLGKSLVAEGLQKGVFDRRADGSVWIDLTADGFDEKLLLRSDGTSVYMTQDLGTAHQRYEEYHPERLIYVVGNEQEYHFQVLKLVLKKLGYLWAESIYHLSYGMVELPEGKMKSREGTVVDADDLMKEMFDTSEAMARELGKIDTFEGEEAKNLYRTIGLGALKYFILKVDPKKNMTFNPAESIDFNGNTGPFIQYTFARIKSVLRKADELGLKVDFMPGSAIEMLPLEKDLLKKIHDFPAIVKQASEMHSPAFICNYIFEVACGYNRFYHDITILKEENRSLLGFRLCLSQFTARVIANALWLLGIDVPERM